MRDQRTSKIVLTSRDRVRRALNHQEPDRVPIDFGQDFHNGINEVAYKNLLAHLGMHDAGPIEIYDLMQRLAVADVRVLERFHVDTRYILANPKAGFDTRLEEDGSFTDEWGVYRKRCGYYCDSIRPPLANLSRDQIARHAFPDPEHPSRFHGLRGKAKALYENGDYALMAGQAASLFYLSAELRGFEQFMDDLAFDEPLIQTLSAGCGMDDGVLRTLPRRDRPLHRRLVDG